MKGDVHGSPEERFWAKVNKTDGCWLWTRCTDRDGYGRFGVDADRVVYSHRFAWELVNGPVPPGKELDHMCYITQCVNPDHLRVLTPKQHRENRRGPQRNSTSGFRGVTFDKQRNKWMAIARNYGKNIYGGRFDTAEEANEAAIALRRKLFTHSDMDVREPNTTPQEESER